MNNQRCLVRGKFMTVYMVAVWFCCVFSDLMSVEVQNAFTVTVGVTASYIAICAVLIKSSSSKREKVTVKVGYSFTALIAFMILPISVLGFLVRLRGDHVLEHMETFAGLTMLLLPVIFTYVYHSIQYRNV